jgi:sugar phosphate isomerase/epimerase
VHLILSEIDQPALRFAWDGANFVRSGEPQPTSDGWELLAPYLGSVHVKDARHDRSQRAAGEGDAQIRELFQKLHETDYEGFLAIEPHAYQVDGRGELTGSEGMTYAVNAARKVLSDLGLSDAPEATSGG